MILKSIKMIALSRSFSFTDNLACVGTIPRVILLILSIPIVTFFASLLYAAEPESNSPETLVEIPGELRKDQVDDLIARLSDEEVRELLIAQLNRVASQDAESGRPSLSDRLLKGMETFENQFSLALGAISDIPEMWIGIWHSISEGQELSTVFILIKIIVLFGLGVLAEKIFRLKSVPSSNVDVAPTQPPFLIRLKLSLPRLLYELFCLLTFLFGTAVAWFVIGLPTEKAQYLFSSLFTGIIVLRLVGAASKFLFAPALPNLQLMSFGTEEARLIHKQVMVVATAVIFLIWWVRDTLQHFNITSPVNNSVIILTSATAVGVIVSALWLTLPGRNRPASGSAPPGSRIEWRVIISVAVIFLYFLALGVALATDTGTLSDFVLSLVVLGIAVVMDLELCVAAKQLEKRQLARESVQPPAGSQQSSERSVATESSIEPAANGSEQSTASEGPKPNQNSQSYASVMIANGRIILVIAVVFGLAKIWDLNLIGIVSEVIGETATRVTTQFLVTLLFAYALWGIVNTAVSRIARPEPVPGEASGEPGGAGGSRLDTLLPLFKKFLFIILLVVLVLVLLSSMGINTGPLIAGAGIFGIAIGFGAQTLVRDIVSGLFFLLDDAFRVGEYVTMGDIRGTVEKISIRSLRLRHHRGPLHTIPFGEIQTLTNMSRDYAIMKFEIRVPFETDVDMVRKLIKKVGATMLEDPELGPQFLEPLKSQGVNRMDDSAFIIRCKFTSKPGNQWVLRREAYARIQAAFEEKGIHFAPRRVVVESAEPLDQTKLAAAAAAIDTQAPENEQGKKS